MTIEEKARAYDEALERAKAAIDVAADKDLVGGVVRTVFPELRGSEDERIRKWLADYFSSIKKTVWVHRDITCEQILDWLEKQKEQKPSIFPPGLGEVHWNPIPSAKKELVEKPAWSEEDEKMLVHVVELLELNCDFSEINNEISWLKSLSRKKIWNKEDERILKGIVGLIDHNQHYDVSNKDMLNWLKSLRPSWKPSEEQMKQLHYALTPGSAFDCDILNELYIQLKKLK